MTTQDPRQPNKGIEGTKRSPEPFLGFSVEGLKRTLGVNEIFV